MKKTALAAIIGLTLALGISAHAEKIEKLTVMRESGGEGMIVSGSLDSAKLNIPLVLIVKNQGEILATAQTVADTAEDGKTVFAFEPIQFADSVPSGRYEYTVSGHFIDQPVTAENVPYYASTEDSAKALQALNDAAREKDIAKTEAALNNFSLELAVDTEQIDALTLLGKRRLYTFLNESEFTFDEADLKSVATAKKAFREKYQRAMNVAEFYDITSNAMLNQWLSDYESSYLQESNALYPYYQAHKGEFSQPLTTLIQSRGDQIQTLNDEEKTVASILTESVLLYNIYKESGAVVKNIYEAFPTVFQPDKTVFAKLNIQKQGEVYMGMSGVLYANAAAADDAFEAKAKEKYNAYEAGGKGGGGGGGSGNSGGQWGNNTNSSPISTPKTEEKTDEFQDIDDVPWAKEAILGLYEKKAISGKATGIFAPNDRITRAEFVKILVSAFGYELPTDYESHFHDVALSDWYSPYIESARNEKLISGDEDGNFRPGDPISREDVCVILARYQGYTGGMGIQAPFADLDEISNYALEAVVYFYKQGIINGKDNNCFKPHDGATRAEAAKIIYGIMTKEAQE